MEKETFIYRNKFDGIAWEIYDKYGVKVVFCKIFGKRWSWFAGFDEYFVTKKKILISENLGVILDKDLLEEDLFNELQ
jgi:hypothetical protein